MARLPGHEPVEIARYDRAYAPADWNFMTREMDPAWEFWGEHRTPDNYTDTPRCRARVCPQGTHRAKPRLASREREQLERDGILPEYKEHP